MADVNNITEFAKLGAGIAMGFGAVGAGLGVGIATKGFLESIARQPEIFGKATAMFMVGAAMAEACAIYALVVSFQLLGILNL